MSISSFGNTSSTVRELMAALAAPASSRVDHLSIDRSADNNKPAFHEVLHYSSSNDLEPGQEQAVSQPEANAQDDSNHAEQPVSENSEAEDNQSEDSKPADTESSDDQAQSDGESQGSEDAAKTSDEQQQEQAGESGAESEAAAAAAAAQLALTQATTSAQTTVTAEAAVGQQAVQADANGNQSATSKQAQAQAVAAPVKGNAQVQGQSQATGPSVEGAAVAAVQTALQTGEQAQANAGDTGGDSKATTQTNSANTSTQSSNAQASSAFTLPDQQTAEAKLPINPTSTAPAVDAARQAQAQPLVNTGDNDAVNTARITRGLANAVQQRGGAVTLRLTPPEMGTVRIQMQITGTNVSAAFHAESTSAQSLLTTQLAQLRSALESKGMTVERLSVQPLAATTSSNNTNQSQNQSDTQQQNQAQQQSAGDGRSRGQYSGNSSDNASQQDADPSSQHQARRGFFERLSDAAESEAA